ncbi:MAG: hypothetical protein MUF06_16325 [Pirellulaceae bacterium]|jgi:hypothetical protein|nr:hypothetical protein [Pirellulaceae bacterium]
MDEIAELRDALDRLHAAFEDLTIRGLRSAGPRDLAKLAALRDEFRDAGAGHLAERLGAAIELTQAGDHGAAAALLRAMTAVRLFDRMLTVEVAASLLAADASAADAEAAREAAAAEED